MKNQELFHKTVNILVQAYLKGTLKHMDPCACLVGNLIAANMNYKVSQNLWEDSNGKVQSFTWYNLIMANRGYECFAYLNEAKKEIEVTGYGLEDIIKLESAFEEADRGQSREDWMFNGLMDGIDCLCEIHEVNEESKAEAKALFIK